MGYLVRASTPRRQALRGTARQMSTIYSPSPMAGDILDTISNGVWAISGNQTLLDTVTAVVSRSNDATQKACLATANDSVKRLDASIMDIAKNWQPSGFYAPDQIATIVTLVRSNLLGPLSTVLAAPVSTSDAQRAIDDAAADLNRLMGNDPSYTGLSSTAKTFTDGADAAVAAGATVVNAPGLKDWVVNALLAGSKALVVSSVLQCNTTLLDTVWSGFVALGNFLKSVGSLIVGAAETVFKIPDAIGTIWTYAKYGAIAAAAYFIWHEFLKNKVRLR